MWCVGKEQGGSETNCKVNRVTRMGARVPERTGSHFNSQGMLCRVLCCAGRQAVEMSYDNPNGGLVSD